MASASSRRPGHITSTACEQCRSKKAKCDGARPACSKCAAKGFDCTYATAEGQTRVQALRDDNASLRGRLDMMETTMAMSQRVLPESEPSAQDNPSSAYSGSTAGVSSLPTSPTSRCPPDQTTSTQYNERVIGNQPSASADFVSSSGLPLGYDLASVLDFMYSQQSAFQRAADNLLKTTGVLLRVYSPEQQKDILRNVYRGRERPLSKVAACELCALAAVGTQFSGGEIPSEGADVLYSIARHFLDDVISSSPLRAVKVVALFSMFNIVNHATVALAYIDLGLSLAYRESLHERQRPENLDPALWTDYKRVWRTLVTLKCWLDSSLGHVSEAQASKSSLALRELEDDPAFELEDLIQGRIADITVLKTKIVRELYMRTDLQASSISALRLELRGWHDRLPQNMQISNLLEPNIAPKSRLAIYFAHLFYLGAMMLLLRRIFSGCTGPDEAALMLQSNVSRDLFEAVDEGFGAAKITARILNQLLVEEAVYQQCWHWIYTSYTSSALLLFDTLQNLYQGLEREKCNENLGYARQSLNVLSHCAEVDPLARRFYQTIQQYFRALDEVVGEDEAWIRIEDGEEVQLSSDEGYETPGRRVTFRTVRNEVFGIVREPFSSLPDQWTQQDPKDQRWSRSHLSAEEAAMGVHLEWVTELDLADPQQTGGRLAFQDQTEDVLSRLHSGNFVKDPKASGWSATTTFTRQAKQ